MWLIFNITIFSIIPRILILLIFLKLGLWPFQFWVFSFVKILSWENFFILISLQKIIPILIIINFRIKNYRLFYLLNMINFIYPIFYINRKNFQKIFIVSSISFFSLILILFNKEISINILFIYFTQIYLLIKFFRNWNIYSSYSLLYYSLNSSSIFLLIILLLSIAGFPPFYIFFLKYITFYIIIVKENIIIFLIFLLSSIFLRYLYINIGIFFLIKLKIRRKTWIYMKHQKIIFFIFFLIQILIIVF